MHLYQNKAKCVELFHLQILYYDVREPAVQ